MHNLYRCHRHRRHRHRHCHWYRHWYRHSLGAPLVTPQLKHSHAETPTIPLDENMIRTGPSGRSARDYKHARPAEDGVGDGSGEAVKLAVQVQVRTAFFEYLPDECKSLMLVFMTHKRLCRVACLSKAWRDEIGAANDVWCRL